MRKIILEEKRDGVAYPVITEEAIIITPKLLRKIALKKLKFNKDLSALEPFEMTEEQTVIQDIQNIRKEISVIEKWFELYDRQVAEFNRCKRLGIVYDNKYGAMDSLDNQAIAKSQMLNELHTSLMEKTDRLRLISKQQQLQQAESFEPIKKCEQEKSSKRIKRFF